MPFPLAYYQQYFNGPIQGQTLLTSDDPGDQTLVPLLGIYSKGDVETAGQFVGTATSSLLADLAERYHADAYYEEGTVLRIGGEFEVTATTGMVDSEVFGVVSKNPGFKMNEGAGSDETHPFVALRGRVPVKVTGEVKKGDRLVSSNVEGVAMSLSLLKVGWDAKTIVFSVIGRALEDKEEKGVALIEVAVGGK